MSIPVSPESQGTSTRPYLIRALHEWCTDNGLTPYLAVHVDESVRVPMEYVKNHEIVLNVGFDATSALKLGNEWIEFKARFGGVAREIMVPVDHVVAIYARENGQGMAFPMPSGESASGAVPALPSIGASVGAEPAAPRGLRLATSEPTPALTEETPPEEPTDPPPAAPSGAGGNAPTALPRPALKRIK
jgi:stringent starvation protein B